MRFLRQVFLSSPCHLILLTGVLAILFLHTRIIPQDNNFDYMNFIMALADGKMDLSIPGFQGASFLALPIYLITHSPFTNIWFQIACALALPAIGYWTARAILRDKFQALLFSYALALMPFLAFVAFRGFTFPSFSFFLLLTLGLRAKGSRWTFLALSISILIKPFSVMLLPFFVLWEPHPHGETLRKGWVQFCLAMILPALYVLIQYLQIGHIMVGTHPDINQSNVFVLQRWPLNILHGIQMMFSIHNFYFPDPAKTGAGNLTHSSPLLLMLGCLSYLYPRPQWKDARLARMLGLSCLLAFLLAALLDHMDHFYMDTAVILLTLGAIPFLASHLLLVPLVLVTFHFQFFYMYLMWRGTYFLDPSLFAMPIIIDIIAVCAWLLFCAPSIPWQRMFKDFFHGT